MTRFLKWFGLIFALHLAFLVAYFGIHPNHDIPTDAAVVYYFLWPFFFISPPAGGSHGGELILSPLTIFLHSFVLAGIVTALKNRRRKPQ